MTNDIIDSVIAEATAQTEAPATPDKPEPEVEAPAEDSQTDDKSEGSSDEVMFPKKAVNAISRRDKKIGKLQAELAALRAAQAQPAQQAPQVQAQQSKQSNTDNAPREEDFESYGDYLKASMRHEIMAEIAKQQQANNEGFQKREAELKRQQYEEVRTEAIVEQMQNHKEEIPDFASVIAESADIADELPEQIANLFFEADDAALAFYNLAKEGKLEALATMSPAKAALEIARAQMNKPQVKKVSSAPAPMTSNSGRASGGKSLYNMSGDEMIKTLGIKFQEK